MSKMTYKFIIKPPKMMRYPTIGDYYKTKNGWIIEVADLGDSDYNFLVFLHEFIELYLTQRRGISEPNIKKFDEWFEREKARGYFSRIVEAGRHPKAPYRHEHIFAEKIEKLLIKELGANWQKYVEAVDKIFEEVKKYKNL